MYNLVLKNFSNLTCSDERMDTFNSVDYDQRHHHHHQNLDYGVDQNDSAIFDNIINSYEKADHELDGKVAFFAKVSIVSTDLTFAMKILQNS